MSLRTVSPVPVPCRHLCSTEGNRAHPQGGWRWLSKAPGCVGVFRVSPRLQPGSSWKLLRVRPGSCWELLRSRPGSSWDLLWAQPGSSWGLPQAGVEFGITVGPAGNELGIAMDLSGINWDLRRCPPGWSRGGIGRGMAGSTVPAAPQPPAPAQREPPTSSTAGRGLQSSSRHGSGPAPAAGPAAGMPSLQALPAALLAGSRQLLLGAGRLVARQDPLCCHSTVVPAAVVPTAVIPAAVVPAAVVPAAVVPTATQAEVAAGKAPGSARTLLARGTAGTAGDRSGAGPSPPS